MSKNNINELIQSVIYHLRNNNDFSRNQMLYLFFKQTKNKNKSSIYRKKTLFSYIGLEEGLTNYFLDDMVFKKTPDCLTEALVGMCLDIFLKDNFFELKNQFIRNNIKDRLQFYFYQEGAYEIEDVQINIDDIVIDAGANMGMFSILAAKKGAIVFAFEPQDIFINFLMENIKLNSLQEKIHVSKYAINKEDAQVRLSVCKDNLLSASINIDRNGENHIIESTSIDNWIKLKQLDRINFIKADIEGAEQLLIDGAIQTLKTFKPKLALATYHFPDDKEILKKKIFEINPEYKFIQTRKILFAY